jgi:hypothetical protein
VLVLVVAAAAVVVVAPRGGGGGTLVTAWCIKLFLSQGTASSTVSSQFFSFRLTDGFAHLPNQ